jgi:hypothetical protein
MESYRAEAAPALVGSVQAARMAEEAAVAVPATSHSADAAPAADRAGMSEASDLQVFAGTYANLLPVVSELFTGLAGSIAILGQAYRDGVPTSVLLDSVASAVGSTPAKIPPELIPLGVAAATTAQEAGIALPAAVADLEGMSGGSQFGEWISAAVGRIETLAAADGSTSPDKASIDGPPPTVVVSPLDRGEVAAFLQAEGSWGDPGPPGAGPNAPPVPPFLISLGRFFLNNIDSIYDNYMQYVGNTSLSMASRPDGITPDGLGTVSDSAAARAQEAQDAGWFAAGWTAYVMARGRSPALSQRPDSQGGEVQSPDSSPAEPVAPAAITAGEIPLDVLLSDPELSVEGASAGIQQIAELDPIEESSLALVATLYALPSESGSGPSDDGDPSGETEGSVPSSASPPRWAAFVIGLDAAFERSGDACAKALSDGARREAEAGGDALEGLLEGRCPILPAPEARPQQQRVEGSALMTGQAAIDRAPPSGEGGPADQRSSEDGSPRDAGGRRPLIEGVIVAAWAASGGALLAGWPWARRRFRPGRARGGNGREGPRRGGEGHS